MRGYSSRCPDRSGLSGRTDRLPDRILAGVVGEQHHRPRIVAADDRQLFEKVAAGRVAVDQHRIGLHRLDVLQQMHAAIDLGY